MAETRKVLGQSNPLATTLTAVYTVPAGTQAVVSSVSVCNCGTTEAAFRVSVAVAGAADATAQYLYRDVPISVGNTFVATLGVTLGPGDVVRGYSSTANLAFQVFGVEVL